MPWSANPYQLEERLAKFAQMRKNYESEQEITRMRILYWLFGCHHPDLSRVWTRKLEDGRREHYRICLRCSREIPFAWEELGKVA